MKELHVYSIVAFSFYLFMASYSHLPLAKRVVHTKARAQPPLPPFSCRHGIRIINGTMLVCKML